MKVFRVLLRGRVVKVISRICNEACTWFNQVRGFLLLKGDKWMMFSFVLCCSVDMSETDNKTSSIFTVVLVCVVTS